MGSYLSAPMLVFRLGVLARACEAPRGADPLATGPDTPTTARISLPLPLIATLPITFRALSAPSVGRPVGRSVDQPREIRVLDYTRNGH